MIRSELITALQSARPLYDLPSGYEHADFKTDPSVICVATPQELGRLVSEAYTELNHPFSEEEHEYVVHHEGQHGYAATLLGARTVEYALRIAGTPRSDGSGTDNIQFIPMTRPQFAGPTSRLMDVVMAAYPTVPSRGDIAFIQKLGYADAGTVAERILEVNADFGLHYPLPLSTVPLL